MFATENFSITANIVLGLQKLSPLTNLITDIFIIIFLFLLLFTIDKRGKQLALHNILITLTFFGVFLGIAIGFSLFDGQNIEKSLPHLFEGLKMAFVIGILGIFVTFLIKWINHKKVKSVLPTTHNITPNDIYRVLKEIRTHTADQSAILSNMVEQTGLYQKNVYKVIKSHHGFAKQELPLLEELKQSIIGQDEFSLATQIQRLSTVQSENIKQFNQAIGKLVTWNPVQMAQMQEQFSHSLSGIEKSRDALQDISTFMQSIPQTMQQLAQLMQGLHQQLETHERHLESFQHLRQQAGDAFPVIEKNLNDLTRGMQQQVQRHLELLETTLETQLDMADVSLETQVEGFQVLQNSFAELGVQVHHKLKNSDSARKEFDGETPLLKNVEKSPEIKEEMSHETSSDDYNILQIQAYTLMDSGDYEEAIAYFDQAIELNSTEFSLFYNKACCSALLGKVHIAIVVLQEAISLNTECFDMAKNDSDFDKIRYSVDFQSFIKNDN
ncbi:MAG: tetratricopeptide repeat protein [Thiomargarita sp.]|nr:tetratricopeptide repeat protein [Thiomargarita sp.]